VLFALSPEALLSFGASFIHDVMSTANVERAATSSFATHSARLPFPRSHASLLALTHVYAVIPSSGAHSAIFFNVFSKSKVSKSLYISRRDQLVHLLRSSGHRPLSILHRSASTLVARLCRSTALSISWKARLCHFKLTFPMLDPLQLSR